MSIHETAVIDATAKIAEGVRIGPYAVVEAEVVIGPGSELLVGTVLRRGARVGASCRLGPYAVVASEPMDAKFGGEASYAVLEDEVELREFASVHRATGEGCETRVGRGSLVMSYAHVSHNVRVGREVTLTTQVQLGGHTEIGDCAVLGSGAVLHQHCRIGAYAMFGAGSGARQDVLPYSVAAGRPARHYRLNRVGLVRRGIDGETYQELESAIRAFRRRDRAGLNALAETSPEVRAMVEFAESSQRGLCRFN